MKKQFYFIVFFIYGLTFYSYSQDFILNGIVKDFESNESLIYATIYSVKDNHGVVSNKSGYFNIQLNQGKQVIEISHVGYKKQKIEINITKDTIIDIYLFSNSELNEIIVTSQKKHPNTQYDIGSIILNPDFVKKTNALLGESDILKSLQTLPGIAQGSEGSTGLYVRGSDPGQNLIMLDDMPIFNSNHLFGLFSVFNTSALKSIQIYKGGFPARYGGRASAIIDVTMKDGSTNKYGGEFEIGLISSKLFFEGPIKKDKSSFIIALRRNYFDLILLPIVKLTSDNVANETAGYHFYDMNIKLNTTLKKKGKLCISLFSAKDKAVTKLKLNEGVSKYNDEFILKWNSLTSALKYKKAITSKLFFNAILNYSNYKFYTTINSQRESDIESFNELYVFENMNSLNSIEFKSDTEYSLNSKIKFYAGLSASNYSCLPGKLHLKKEKYSVNSIDTVFTNNINNLQQIDFYIESQIKIFSKLHLNTGIRNSNAYTNSTYYSNLEPRFILSYDIFKSISLKTSYSKNCQYLHLVNNSILGMPSELWLPASESIKPIFSDIYSIGLFFDISGFSFSFDSYYKKVSNIIELKDGADIFSVSNNWSDQLEQGLGLMYGIDFYLQKKFKRFTGNLSYTLAFSNRNFNTINNGKLFHYTYDRRHNVNINILYKISNSILFSANWIYQSGYWFTLSEQYYTNLDNNQSLLYLNGRNNLQSPDYHRLDIGLVHTKEKTKGIREFKFSVYNVYNKQNPYHISLNYKDDSYEIKQLTMFPVIPSISYVYKF